MFRFMYLVLIFSIIFVYTKTRQGCSNTKPPNGGYDCAQHPVYFELYPFTATGRDRGPMVNSHRNTNLRGEI